MAETKNQNNGNSYAFRKFLFIFTLILFIACVVFAGLSYYKTCIAWNNNTKQPSEIWTEITKQWWSFWKIKSQTDDGSLQLTFSTFGIILIVIAGICAALTIADIILLLLIGHQSNKKPKSKSSSSGSKPKKSSSKSSTKKSSSGKVVKVIIN